MKSTTSATNKLESDRRLKRDDTPYPMTPEQYYDQLARSRHLDGESRLLFAVLEDAIRCYTLAARTGRRSHQRALEEVREWVNMRGDHDLFSFDSICNVSENASNWRMALACVRFTKHEHRDSIAQP